MNHRIVTILLACGVLFAGVLLASQLRDVRLPGDHTGYEPVQPIAFSHRLHAGELGMACQSCHTGAERSRHAGIPAASTCMSCHQFVTAPLADVRAEAVLAQEEGRSAELVVSPELRTLYDALGLDGRLQPAHEPEALAWVRVHTVPDFVYFDHRAHVTAGVTCQSCHGPVETMERVRQVESLGMGWCVACHRESQAAQSPVRHSFTSLDCAACHY